MDRKLEKVEAIFFKTESGIEPVRDWLTKLTKADKKSIGEDIKQFSLAGHWVCHWLGIEGRVCGKLELNYKIEGLLGLFFLWMKMQWCWSMGLSRKPKKHLKLNWIWHDKENGNISQPISVEESIDEK